MIYDITPPISERLAVWPGDTPPSREVLCDMRRGDNLTLSTLHATVHLGAHADSPSHYTADAPAIHDRPLDLYLGPCQLIRLAVPRGACIKPDGITLPIAAERVLFSTGTYRDPEHFHEDFAALTPELIEWLAARG
ncbi:MAG: cyclase family protein, partial [Planctomycetes bacterium]|nr:cyclase family protein [Planctomycetota bacterium]